MNLTELDAMTDEQWRELGAEEPGAWGGGAAEDFQWREKDRHIALIDPSGSTAGVAQAVLVEIAVAPASPFEVVGIGGVFVRASERGKGLMRRLVEEIIALAGEMGPQRAMLFCHPDKTAVYASFGFREITDPVWVEQPGGPVEMPLSTMWLTLRGAQEWPAGRVEVQGLPF